MTIENLRLRLLCSYVHLRYFNSLKFSSIFIIFFSLFFFLVVKLLYNFNFQGITLFSQLLFNICICLKFLFLLTKIYLFQVIDQLSAMLYWIKFTCLIVTAAFYVSILLFLAIFSLTQPVGKLFTLTLSPLRIQQIVQFLQNDIVE